MRVLPQSPQLPNYLEHSFFIPVVIVFGIIDSLYLFFSFYVLSKNYFLWSGPSIVLFTLHYLLYLSYSKYRETSYLKSNILGVDVDGVLNKHRKQFCSFLSVYTKKRINPDQINIIPVHEQPNLNITEDEERLIFNTPEYWTKIPVVENAVGIIRKLRNIFRLKIYIFTCRPWPDNPIKDELLNDTKKFIQNCSGFSIKTLILRFILYIPIIRRMSFSLKEEPLKQITKTWLKKNGFKYNKLIFEKGNDYSLNKKGKFKNRFYIASKKRIKFFIEDDIEKAIKLSYFM